MRSPPRFDLAVEVNEAVRVEQRAASMRLVEMLAASDDQVIRLQGGLAGRFGSALGRSQESLREQIGR